MDRNQLQQKYEIIGESPVLKQALDKALQVAPTDITVLLNGETGVGKDVMARAIHDMSHRHEKKLVIVNCGAIPEGIIESELFGNEKGAYTDAHQSRMGYFEQADGGTIFLDEIVDTPKNVQVKLLRVLENGEFFRVGSSKSRTANVRVIAATNKDMWKCVENGDFREDLFYRINTVTISIPPLRERNGDILLIFNKFVSEFAQKYDSVFRGMSDEARQLLLSYRWPGNIRELRNVAEQLVVLEKSQFLNEDVLKKYLKGRQSLGSPDNLPMIYGEDDSRNNDFQSSQNHDIQLVYRALLDMKNDMSDMKRMMGTLFYNTFRSGNVPRSLPAPGSSGAQDAKSRKRPGGITDPSGISIGMAPYSNIDEEEDQNHPESRNDPDLSNSRYISQKDPDEPESLTDDQREVINLFDTDDLPSVEEVEKFLIRRALDKYKGNRRKAARILGMSERTLYRKIDQYEIL